MFWQTRPVHHHLYSIPRVQRCVLDFRDSNNVEYVIIVNVDNPIMVVCVDGRQGKMWKQSEPPKRTIITATLCKECEAILAD